MEGPAVVYYHVPFRKYYDKYLRWFPKQRRENICLVRDLAELVTLLEYGVLWVHLGSDVLQ